MLPENGWHKIAPIIINMKMYIREPAKLKEISLKLLLTADTVPSSDEIQYFPRSNESEFIKLLINPIIMFTINGYTIIAAIDEPFFFKK